MADKDEFQPNWGNEAIVIGLGAAEGGIGIGDGADRATSLLMTFERQGVGVDLRLAYRSRIDSRRV